MKATYNKCTPNHLWKSLLFGLITALLNNVHATDYRKKVIGMWNCQSSIDSDYGHYTVIGKTLLSDNGILTGEGDILLQHPSISTDIPMAYSTQARWNFENNTIIGTKITGDITSPYPLLNHFAQSLKNQIGSSPYFKARLSRIGSKTMTLVADDESEIQCLRL